MKLAFLSLWLQFVSPYSFYHSHWMLKTRSTALTGLPNDGMISPEENLTLPGFMNPCGVGFLKNIREYGNILVFLFSPNIFSHSTF